MKNNTFLLLRLLEMCDIIDGERSTKGIANILYGKRNHQTWSDLHLYDLHKYYRYLHGEDAVVFSDALQILRQYEYITLQAHEVAKVTAKGKHHLSNAIILSEHYARDGRIISSMHSFWLCLQLLIQTLSNLLYRNKSFIPVIRDTVVQSQVKQWINIHGIFAGAKGLHSELTELISLLPECYREMLILRLSGKDRIGLTLVQISKRKNKSYWEVKWEWESLLYLLYTNLQIKKYHYLPKILQETDILLSKSSEETFVLLQKGMSITEISQARNLKEATIMDHIIELTLQGIDVNTSNYITDDEVKKVEEIYQKLGTKRLKVYKDRLSNFTYFQIRLALSIIGRGTENGAK